MRRSVFFGAFALGACGLFPSVGDLDAPGADASVDAITDVAVDAIKTSDANVETGSGDWCASQAAGFVLCSDFDQSGGVTQGFDIGLEEVQNGTGGSFALDPTSFVSAPNGALGIANPFGAGQVSGTRIIGTMWPLGPTPKTLDCQFQWKPVALSTTANDYAHVFSIAFYSDAQQNDQLDSINLNMQGDGSLVLLEYGSQNATHTVPIAITTSSGWIAVDVSLTFGASSSYHLTVGAAVAPGSAFVNAIPSTSHTTLEVGPAYFGGATTSSSPGWTFDYDNVLCR